LKGGDVPNVWGDTAFIMETRTRCFRISSEGGKLVCRHLRSGTTVQVLEKHQQAVCMMQAFIAEGFEHVCTYDGEHVIIWRVDVSGLAFLETFKAVDVCDVYMVEQNLVLYSENKTIICAAGSKFSPRDDERYHSPEDRISAIAECWPRTIAIGWGLFQLNLELVADLFCYQISQWPGPRDRQLEPL
jgi:hypothetical protein